MWRSSNILGLFAVAALSAHAAGPVDFGLAELNAAMDARKLKYKPRIVTEINLEPPETFKIEPYTAGGGRISGGDLRGLMYGLLEAADQMRATGRLKQTHGVPSTTPRGVKIAADPTATWFSAEDFWRDFLASLARNRFNRLQLLFDRLPGPDSSRDLRNISQLSLQYGVDLALGIKAAPDEFGPALLDLLGQCPAVRSVSLNGEADSIKPSIAAVLKKAGRRVVLEENRLWQIDPAQNASDEAGVRAVVSTLSSGFEVAAPLGAGKRPEPDAIRHWGRFGYDAKPRAGQ
jgi:hypothetical protein